jgi:transposase
VGQGLGAQADAAGEVDWTVSVDSTINRAHQHATTMSRTERPAGRLKGADSNYTSRAADPGREPPDHALGRSRCGVSTKIHQLVDGKGRPPVVALTGGQAGDSPMLKVLLADLAVARPAGGRPPAFDAAAYTSRKVIERSFNDHKQWRGLATRYDKLATTYREGVVLRAIAIWQPSAVQGLCRSSGTVAAGGHRPGVTC